MSTPHHRSRSLTATLAALLVSLVFLAFGRAVTHGLVNYDDQFNFSNNWHLQEFGPGQLGWAFSARHLGVYQPLGWILLGTEWRLGGGDPRVVHAVSILIHAVNALLLWTVLSELSRRALPQATPRDRQVVAWLGAALFAVHPLRTEVVAWASCQPYLPSATCFLLAIRCHLLVVDPDAPPHHRRLARLGTAVSFALALLFKAPAVTLPLVLLILDVYPLRRWPVTVTSPRAAGRAAGRLLLEKLPLLLMAGAMVAVTVWARAADVRDLQQVGVGARLAQLAYAFWFYLGKLLFPWPLHQYYVLPAAPDPGEPVFLQAMLALAALAVLLFMLRARAPWLLAAVMAYAVILAPNLGLVFVQGPATADRYAYLGSLPWSACVAAAAMLLLRARIPVAKLLTGGAVLLAGLMALSVWQTGLWVDSVRLWSHSVQHAAREHPMSRRSLAHARFEQGAREGGKGPAANPASRMVPVPATIHPDDEADHETRLAQLRQAASTSRSAAGLLAVANGFILMEKLPEARDTLRRALVLAPQDPATLGALGAVEILLGDKARDGEALLRRALASNPYDSNVRLNLAVFLLNQRRYREAAAEFRRVLQARPDLAPARRGLEQAQAAEAAAAVPGDQR